MIVSPRSGTRAAMRVRKAYQLVEIVRAALSAAQNFLRYKNGVSLTVRRPLNHWRVITGLDGPRLVVGIVAGGEASCGRVSTVVEQKFRAASGPGSLQAGGTNRRSRS
jgi:hypothetical protein